MKRLIASLSLVAALLPVQAGAYMTVVHYNDRTNLHDTLQRDRADVLSRIRSAQTNQQTGETNERAYNVNVTEIGKWNNAFECNQGINRDVCLTRAEF